MAIHTHIKVGGGWTRTQRRQILRPVCSHYSYSVEDPAFRDSVGNWPGPPLIEGNRADAGRADAGNKS